MLRHWVWIVSAACLLAVSACASRQRAEESPPPAAAPKTQAGAPAPQAKAAPAPQAKTAPAPAAKAPERTDGRKVKSKDGKTDGEIYGTVRPKSKFARVEIGMSRTAVEKLIGTPDDSESHPTGRTFTPFYFGGDTVRYEAFYKGEGQLTYSNASRYSSPDTLTIIWVDPKEKGVRH